MESSEASLALDFTVGKANYYELSSSIFSEHWISEKSSMATKDVWLLYFFVPHLKENTRMFLLHHLGNTFQEIMVPSGKIS